MNCNRHYSVQAGRTRSAFGQTNCQLEKRSREIEEELLLAKKVQESLVPKALAWGGGSVDTFYQPARAIGGDFGLVSLGLDYLDVMVCDVSGHGIGSALVANRVYTEIMELIQRGTEPTPGHERSASTSSR